MRVQVRRDTCVQGHPTHMWGSLLLQASLRAASFLPGMPSLESRCVFDSSGFGGGGCAAVAAHPLRQLSNHFLFRWQDRRRPPRQAVTLAVAVVQAVAQAQVVAQAVTLVVKLAVSQAMLYGLSHALGQERRTRLEGPDDCTLTTMQKLVRSRKPPKKPRSTLVRAMPRMRFSLRVRFPPQSTSVVREAGTRLRMLSHRLQAPPGDMAMAVLLIAQREQPPPPSLTAPHRTSKSASASHRLELDWATCLSTSTRRPQRIFCACERNCPSNSQRGLRHKVCFPVAKCSFTKFSISRIAGHHIPSKPAKLYRPGFPFRMYRWPLWSVTSRLPTGSAWMSLEQQTWTFSGTSAEGHDRVTTSSSVVSPKWAEVSST